MKSSSKYLYLVIFPALLLFVSLQLDAVRGYFYLSVNSDPCYLYLINSLNIALLKPLQHVDNPGVTVNLIGGMVIRAMSFVRGAADVEKDVLLNPEMYLEAINRVFIILNVMALLLAGIVVFRLTNNIALSMLLQYAPFVSWSTIKPLARVAPEQLLLFSSLFMVLLVVWIAEKKDLEKRPLPYSILFALISGFGVATKLTFIPLLAIPLIMLPQFKWKLVYLLLTCSIFHIIFIPAFSHYDYFMRWATNIFTHSGTYGEGKQAIIEPSMFLQHLRDIFIQNYTFLIAILAAFLVLVLIWLKKELRMLMQENIYAKALFASLIAMLVETLFVAKHFNYQYLVSGLLLCTPTAYFIWRLFPDVRGFYPGLLRKRVVYLVVFLTIIVIFFLECLRLGYTVNILKYIIFYDIGYTIGYIGILLFYFLIFGVICLLIYYFLSKNPKPFIEIIVLRILLLLICFYHFIHINGLYSGMDKSANQGDGMISYIEENYKDMPIIFSTNSSSQYYALKYGASFNFPQKDYFSIIEELYPNAHVYFNGLSSDNLGFSTWTKEITLETIMNKEREVVLQVGLTNPSYNKFLKEFGKYKMESIFNSEFEIIFLLKIDSIANPKPSSALP